MNCFMPRNYLIKAKRFINQQTNNEKAILGHQTGSPPPRRMYAANNTIASNGKKNFLKNNGIIVSSFFQFSLYALKAL